MKPARPQRFFFTIILSLVLLPVSLAYAGFPGPYPPDPPAIPTPPPDEDFNYVKVDDARGQSGVTEQIEFGTSGKDKIIEYGGLDDITQYIGGDAANDWLLQVGGSQASAMTIDGGAGDDTIYQYGGLGNSDMNISAGGGNDSIIQVGGVGGNKMNVYGGAGNDYIEVYGGSGNNTIFMSSGAGDNVVKIYGGPRNNTITYAVDFGNDTVTILGGRGGSNSLAINGGSNSFTLKDYQGKTLCKQGDAGPTITIANLNRVTVIGEGGKIIYQYTDGTVPAAVAPLLLGN
jgi:Ca2+-binding RTX toxin-like protein